MFAPNCPGSSYPKGPLPLTVTTTPASFGPRPASNVSSIEFVIADDPGPVEALLLPDKLAMHDAHQFELDIGSADEVAIDFAFEVAQRIGEMGQRVPPLQGSPVTRFLVPVPDHF